MDVRVVTIPLCEVQYHPRAFDSNNHPLHQLPRGHQERLVEYPEEYRGITARTYYSRWKPLRKLEHEVEFELTAADCQTICEAGMSGALTMRLPESHQEEIQSIAARMEMPRPPYFARLDPCSTKGGSKGVGPFHTPTDVLTALVTSYRCCDNLKRAVLQRVSMTLYLLPWRDDVSIDREFRTFVRDWRATAISQYNWTDDCGWSERAHALPEIAHNIARLVADIRERNRQLDLNLPSEFCADVFCHPNLSVDLIELNSYGAQLAAGSCLFHWVKDYDQLYGLCNASGRFEVDYRIVRPTSASEEALLDLEGRAFPGNREEVDDLLASVQRKLAALEDGEEDKDPGPKDEG